MDIFWRLLFGHLLADFTFQTDFINRWKRRSVRGVLFHSAMHPVFYVALCWPFLGREWIGAPFHLGGWACVGLVFVSHFLEDWWRVHAIRAYDMPDNTLFFLWDQVIHDAILFAVAPMAAASAAGGGFFPEKWPVLGCLFVLVTHGCTVLVYFLEKDLRGAVFPGFDEKYLAMAERLVLALCLLFPSPLGAAGLAAAWLAVMITLRRGGLFDLSAFTFYLGSALALLGGGAARVLYY